MPATTTATRTLTTTEAAVLSLLAIEGENSGYDLLKYVQKAIGYVWAPARSQLYSLLPRLVKDGYARNRSVTQAERPDKTLYKITQEGRRALDAWLTHVDPDDRAAFQLRLFVGALTDDDVLVRHVEAFRNDTAERLAEYRGIEPTNSRSGADFYHYLLLRRGIQQAELDLEWADWVLRELRRPHA
jgi:PadR family transcriptional regulator AphA